MLPRVRIGSGICIVLFPFTLSVPFVSSSLLFCLCGGVWRVGKCGGVWCVLFPAFSSYPLLLLPTVCVLCHSIVGLGLCLCDRVVSLWDSGDGLCGVEGRLLSTIYCPLLTLMCCGVCFDVVCVLSCCVVLWVVEWRCVSA